MLNKKQGPPCDAPDTSFDNLVNEMEQDSVPKSVSE